MAVMANQACMVFDFFCCSSPGILRQPLHLARERETFWYLFRLCTPYGSRASLTGEEEEEERRRRRRKKMTIFDFFKIRLLSFCTAELKSEDIFVLRRVRAFSGYSFCWLNPQTTCLLPLPIVLSKHFNHPHPYIEIATAISDSTYGTRQKKVSGLSVSTSKVHTVLPTVLRTLRYPAIRAQFCGRSMFHVKKSL